MSTQEDIGPAASHGSLLSRHNILLTIPRTASNLVIRLLNLPGQTSVLPHPHDGYFFFPVLRFRYMHDLSVSVQDWSKEVDDGYTSALREGVDAWLDWTKKAEDEGKGTFIKEHINWMITPEAEDSYRRHTVEDDAYSKVPLNPTCVSRDVLLSKAQVTFLIRHPALTFPSLFRTAIDNEGSKALLTKAARTTFKWEATFHWHVQLYRYLLTSAASNTKSLAEDGFLPLIIDASDLSNSEFVRKYARKVGLYPHCAQFEWQRLGEEQQEQIPKVEARMKDTILKSTGVVRSKLVQFEEASFQEEREKWMVEFGDSLGQFLIALVDDALHDYKWLWERRFQI